MTTLSVSRDPDTGLQADWYPVRSDWAETFWLPIIGPTSYLLLRRFDADQDTNGNFGVLVYDWVELSESLGLRGADGRGVTGSHSQIGRAVKRITEQFHLARWDNDRLLVPSRLPPLTPARSGRCRRRSSRGTPWR